MLDRLSLTMRDAMARPSSWDAKARTIEAVIASNAPVSRRDAQGEFLEILDPAGADLSALRGASVLDGHDQSGVASVIGVVEDARVEAGEIIARLRLSSRPELDPVVRDIGDGVIRHLSVGYSVEAWTDGTQAGKRSRTATKWTPREVSFVAVPADRNAHTRSTTMTTTTTDRPAINRSIRELAQRAGVATTITNDLIDRQATIDEARAAILDDIVRRGSISIMPTRDHQTFDDPEFFRTTVADGLYVRIDPKSKPSEAARQYVGMSLVEIGRVVLQRNGVNVTGLGPDGIVTRALESTSDYPAIMANVLNKSLRVAYEAAPSGLKDVARQTSAVDFRAKMRIMLDSTGFKLEAVPETGEFKHGSMVDASESYSVSTFGKIFGITRKVIVNDDLDAFGDISRRLGIAAAQFEAQTLADLLLANAGLGPVMQDDSKTLFHADHGNLASTGAAPSVDTLSAARQAMRLQTGKGGGLISVTPRALVVGADLETAGEKLIAEIRPVVVDEVNPFSKLQRLVVEPRLPAKAWYMVADAAEIDGLEYCYLASSPGPQLETRLGFEVDGLQVRVRLDFGGGFVDWRGWYYNPGQ
jgi:phage head maturation protease